MFYIVPLTIITHFLSLEIRRVTCSYICTYGILDKIIGTISMPCIHIYTFMKSVAGAGIGEGNTYQRVYVDDGSTAVGPLDYLVHQTAPLSLNLHLSGHSTTQGIYTYTWYHIPCWKVRHVHDPTKPQLF